MSMEETPKPYRVEWRYSGQHLWMLHHESNSHEEAIELAEDAVACHQGYARIVVQHVIHRTRAQWGRAVVEILR